MSDSLHEDRFAPSAALSNTPTKPLPLTPPSSKSPARDRIRVIQQRATSMFGFRSLQSINSLRSFDYYGRKSSSPRNHKSVRSAAAGAAETERLHLIGRNDRLPTICITAPDSTDAASTPLSFPILDDRDFVNTTPEATSTSTSTTTVIRIPLLDANAVRRHPSPIVPSSRKPRPQYQNHSHSRYHMDHSNGAVLDEQDVIDSNFGTDGVIESAKGVAEDSGTLERKLLDVDTTVRQSMSCPREASPEMLHIDPSPMSLNPPTVDGREGGDDDGQITLRDRVSFSIEVQAKLDAIHGNASTTTRPLSLFQQHKLNRAVADGMVVSPSTTPAQEVPLPDTPPTSMPSSPTHSSAPSTEPQVADLFVDEELAQMKFQFAALQAANNTALLTLKAAHEGSIAMHEATIASHESTIRTQKASIVRHEGTIADLSRQLRSRNAEQASLLEYFCAEMASRNKENGVLKLERWNMMGRIAELEQIIESSEVQLRLGGQAPVTTTRVAGRPITIGTDETRP